MAGIGRDVALSCNPSPEQTAINIVVATGYYTFYGTPHFVEVRA